MFQKGVSGNAAGRPKGSVNKAGGKLREMVNNFLEANFEKVIQDFEALEPEKRAKVFCDLLPYALPKLQSMEFQTDFDRMTENELDYIIQSLKIGTHDQEGEN